MIQFPILFAFLRLFLFGVPAPAGSGTHKRIENNIKNQDSLLKWVLVFENGFRGGRTYLSCRTADIDPLPLQFGGGIVDCGFCTEALKFGVIPAKESVPPGFSNKSDV